MNVATLSVQCTVNSRDALCLGVAAVVHSTREMSDSIVKCCKKI